MLKHFQKFVRKWKRFFGLRREMQWRDFELHGGQKSRIIGCIMPSFDIVSQVNSMEIENAVNQAKKELANRFDFKGSNAEILLEKNEIKLSATDAFKVQALNEMVIGRLAKRNVSLKSVEQVEPEVSPLGHVRQTIKIKQ